MRILIVTSHFPYPPVSGAPLRSYNLLQRIARDHDVYLAACARADINKQDIAQNFSFCRDLVIVEPSRLGALQIISKCLKWTFQGGPLELRLFFSDQLARRVKDLTEKIDFDVVLIEHGSMGLYLKVIPYYLRKKSAWVLHDIDFEQSYRISHIEKKVCRKIRLWAHSVMMRRFQPNIAEQFGLCIAVSEADRQLLLKANRRLRVEVSPNGVDTELYRPIPEHKGNPSILFIGNMGYTPNIDGAEYFCKDVLPLIRRTIPNTEFWIVGIDPSETVKKLNGDGVFVTGRVPDVAPFYERSKVCVVPIRAGSGTRLKILEAMAFCRPVISTSIGAEGIEAVDGKHIFIADDNLLFAERAIELLTNNNLRTTIAKEARRHVESLYNWDFIAKNLLNVLEGIAK